MNHDLMLDNGLQANLEAERMVLAGAVSFGHMSDLRELLSAADWSLEKHRLIWEAACTLHDSGSAVDRVSLAEELMRRGRIEAVDGFSYLASLEEGMPRIPNIDGYVRIVKDKAFMRR